MRLSLTHLPRGPTLLALGVVLGLAAPALAAHARPLMAPAIVVIVFGTLLRVDPTALVAAFRRPALAIMLPCSVMIACPLAVGFGAGWLGLQPELAMALVLAVSAPPSSGTAAVARMLGLDDAGPLVVTLLSIALAPLTIPLLADSFGDLAISPGELAVRLTLLVGGAGIAAWLVRRYGKASLLTHGAVVDGAIMAALLLFAVATMAGIRDQIDAEPQAAALCLGLAFGVNIGLMLAGAWLWPGSLRERLTIGLVLANRNIGLVWSAIGTAASPRMTLFFAASQLPIYLGPVLLEAILKRPRLRPATPNPLSAPTGAATPIGDDADGNS